MSGNGAQDDGARCVRQNRVVLTPVAGAKLPVANLIQPDRLSHQAGSDGGKTNSSPGRARHKPSTHCAGNAGVLRLYLYARVRTSSCPLHTRPRVQQAPGIPCSLRFRGRDKFMQTSGTVCRENAKLYPRHCERSEAIHSAACGDVDCFAALAMTRIGRGAPDTPYAWDIARRSGRTKSSSQGDQDFTDATHAHVKWRSRVQIDND
jgi:hypothetical protein